MPPKIDFKMKRKLTWEYANIIRLQGAKTSKTMLPCKRRVHLHKSASFKMIFEQFQKKYKNIYCYIYIYIYIHELYIYILFSLYIY